MYVVRQWVQRENNSEWDYRDGMSRGDTGHARPVGEREDHPPHGLGWPSQRQALRQDHVQRPAFLRDHQTAHGVRGTGRHSVPAPHRSGDPAVHRPAEAAQQLDQGREGPARGARDRGIGAEPVPGQHDRRPAVPGDIGWGEEEGEHRAGNADQPEPAAVGRAHLGAGLDHRAADHEHAQEAGRWGSHRGHHHPPALQPSLPHVRQGRLALRRLSHL